MDGTTTSRTEVIKPLFLKAGIPLVLSVAGFVYARVVLRRITIAKSFSCQTTASSSLDTIDSNDDFRDEASIHSLQSTSPPIKDDAQEDMVTSSQFWSSTETSHIQVEEEISGLRNKIEELQKREHSLAMQFLNYRIIKEQECVHMELKNLFVLETTRIEFLEREISSIEAEARRFENLVTDYLRVLEQLEFAKKQNGLLERKVKKLSRRTKEQSHVIGEKNAKINDVEAELIRCCEMLETRTNVIKKLEDEVRECQAAVTQLQEEKNDLLVNLNTAETPASSISKIEAEGTGMEDYNQIVIELEQLHKDREAETTELIHLRWANACLRHELMRSHGQPQQLQIEDKKKYLEFELGRSGEISGCGLEQQPQHEEPCSGVASSGQTFSRKKKLLKKLKKWVEGGDSMKSNMDEKEKHEINCFGRHSLSEEAEEEHLIHSRRSCSSA